MRSCLYPALISLVIFVCFCDSLQDVIDNRKFRVCIVEGRGGYKRAGKFCPTLDKDGSKVECVIGIDRLDCLRKIGKGKADFAVFTAEDLVIALNSHVDILVTNELRFSDQPFEFETVAVVSTSSGITNPFELRKKRFCHPGFGYEADWTGIIANFFESVIVPQSCAPNISLTENRIKASSEYFGAACKAGAWVHDDQLDHLLKAKYPNLCSLCANQRQCSTHDKYWGRRGPLYCLTDGVGDVSWARLDDVLLHFGITPGAKAASPNDYKFLCRDGLQMPLNAPRPCVWVAKPWQVIAARRTSAAEVQKFITGLSHHGEVFWESALLNLIETYHFDISTINPMLTPEQYLARANGFLSANSYSGCHPPRTIRLCTTSNVENAKCGWLREVATVYGVEPDIGCVRAFNVTQCMKAVKDNMADVVMVNTDMYVQATRDFNLTSLIFEKAKMENLYTTVTVVKKNSNIHKFEDLRGLSVCFPSYEGIAWNTVIETFRKKGWVSHGCNFVQEMAEFFGDSCVPGMHNGPKSLTNLCKNYKSMDGEMNALECLVKGHGDVAFVDLNTLKMYADGAHQNTANLKFEDFRLICNENKQCTLSLAQPAQIMIRSGIMSRQKHELYDVFMQFDNLFGNYFKSLTPPFSLYGLFDGQKDVLFSDRTDKLSPSNNVNKMKSTYWKTDLVFNNYHSLVQNVLTCSSNKFQNNVFVIFVIVLVNIFL